MKRVEFTDEEIRALAVLMNAGIKALGWDCVESAAHLKGKLLKAQPVEEPDELEG